MLDHRQVIDDGPVYPRTLGMQGIATMSHGAKGLLFIYSSFYTLKDLSMKQGSLFCFAH